MSEPAKKTISLRLDQNVYLNACDLAEAEGRSFNNWAARQIEQAITWAKVNSYSHPDKMGVAVRSNVSEETIRNAVRDEFCPNRVSDETANHPDPFVAEPSPEQVAARAALNLERPVQRDEFGNPDPIPEGMAGLVRAVNVEPEVARQIGANLVHEANKPERKSRFRNPPSKPLDRKTVDPIPKGKAKK